MKAFLTLVCCLALTSMVHAEDQNNKNKKPKPGQGGGQQHQQVHQKTVTKGTQHLGNTTGNQLHTTGNKTTFNKTTNINKTVNLNKTTNINKTSFNKYQIHNYKNFHAKMNPAIESVKFNGNYHIVGSEHWGHNYVVFSNYHPLWHDHFWWHSHYDNVVLIGGGWYYWNAGYWFPAWGYDPGVAYYPYDGPIYTPAAGVPPDQIVASVQSTLQEQGYYQGDVDGLLGPLTRAALADYQRDHGLEITSAIDEPTVSSLGIS